MIETLAAERRALVARLRGLPDADWQRPSLCAGWSVHHVVAHLTTPFLAGVPRVVATTVRTRGISAAMDAVARDLAAQHAPERLLDVLEAHAASPSRPPGLPLAAPLTDAVCHSADVRWALGDGPADWGDPARLVPVLRFLTSRRAALGFVPRGRLRGVALLAEDVGLQSGSGAPVHGPALVVAMAVLGRPEALPLLTGEGVARLGRAPA